MHNPIDLIEDAIVILKVDKLPDDSDLYDLITELEIVKDKIRTQLIQS